MKNLHLLKIKYLGPTNFRGSRIRIKSERFNQSITVSWDYSANSSAEIAINHLQKLGFEFIGQAEGGITDYLISTTFKKLK
jgi:hypothetical protein